MTHWALVEADLAQFYQLDLRSGADLATLPWRMLRNRIAGLASVESRLAAKLAPKPNVSGKR
jgi:hypothetical protein